MIRWMTERVLSAALVNINDLCCLYGTVVCSPLLGPQGHMEDHNAQTSTPKLSRWNIR